MEKYYCDRCRRLFHQEEVCEKCLLKTKKILIHNHFQVSADKKE